VRFLPKQFRAALLLAASGALCATDPISAPDVELTATPARDIAKRLEDVPVIVRLTNKSAILCSNLKITLVTPDFSLRDPVTVALLPPFGSVTKQISIRVLDSANFTSHHPVLVTDFDWGTKPVYHSARSAPLTLQVVHEYEDEAKGLPGGSAALLYLILPIVPFFLAYDLVDGIRLGQDVKIPKFDTAYLAPAFLLAIVIEYLLVLGARRGFAIDLTDPRQLLAALAISTVAGAAWPGLRIIGHSLNMLHAFRETDALADYLRKAIRQCPEGRAQWVQGSGVWEHFTGLLLTQPDKKTVLGARLQVSAKSKEHATTLAECFDTNDSLTNSAKLLELVGARAVTVALLESLLFAGEPSQKAVITHGLEGFTYQNPESKPIVERVA
jgi:hypothetical protein